ncbi:MAG TPA: TraB/GumN family protein [Thermoplasmata archaeon]
MITLIGVGHVFDLSGSIRRAIEARRPKVVGIELDEARFAALQAGAPRGPPLSLYGLIAFIQRRIARDYGTQAGGEMLAAATAARDVGAGLAFLDMDSRAVLARLMRTMTLAEKVRFATSVFGGLFLRKERVDAEIEKFDANQGAFFDELARDFPAIKRVLIDERNAHMAGALRTLEADHGSVVAVVGEGHVEGLASLLADRSPELVRLRDLRGRPMEGNASVTVSVGG